MKIMEKMKIDPEGFFEILWTSDKSQVATMVLKPGQESSSEKEYHKADQITYCLEGEGTVTVETKKIILKEKELIALKAKEPHHFKNTGKKDWKVLILYAPPEY